MSLAVAEKIRVYQLPECFGDLDSAEETQVNVSAGEVALAVEKECYANSFRVLRKIGQLSIDNCLETDQGRRELDEGRADFVTAIQEHLATDTLYGDRLVFEPTRILAYKNGHTMASNGDALVDIVARGAHSSQEAVKLDSRMELQARRDARDAEVIARADSLAVGEMYAAVSCAPNAAISQDADFWEGRMGYRKGMAVLQMFYRLDEERMLTGAYSIKNSTSASLGSLLRSQGVEVPPSVSDEDVICYGIRKEVAPDAASDFGDRLREYHKAQTGHLEPQLSVTRLVEDNHHLLETVYRVYMVPLAEALVSGKNSHILQGLARTLLHKTCATRLAPEYERSLQRLTQFETLSEEDANTMAGAIRLMVVEDLRKVVVSLLGPKPSGDIGHRISMPMPTANMMPEVWHQALHNYFSDAFQNGVEAGRSYGGCSTIEALKARESTAGPQDIVGRIEDADPNNEGIGRKHRGACRVPGCPNSTKKVVVGGCDVCLVSCQKKFDRGWTLEQIVRYYGKKAATAKAGLKA